MLVKPSGSSSSLTTKFTPPQRKGILFILDFIFLFQLIAASELNLGTKNGNKDSSNTPQIAAEEPTTTSSSSNSNSNSALSTGAAKSAASSPAKDDASSTSTPQPTLTRERSLSSFAGANFSSHTSIPAINSNARTTPTQSPSPSPSPNPSANPNPSPTPTHQRSASSSGQIETDNIPALRKEPVQNFAQEKPVSRLIINKAKEAPAGDEHLVTPKQDDTKLTRHESIESIGPGRHILEERREDIKPFASPASKIRSQLMRSASSNNVTPASNSKAAFIAKVLMNIFS